MSNSFAADSEVHLPFGGLMAWLVCLSAGLFFFYEFFQLNIFDVINLPLREDFNIDATQLSWMSSTYLWADILFLIPAGIILDRYSTRRVMLIAMLVCVLGTIGFSATHSFFLASFFHFLSGIGNAFCFLSCAVLVSRWFPPRRQAFVIGLLVTMAFLGGMMAHTPFAHLIERFGWRNALIIDGAVGILLLLWIYTFVQDTPNETFERPLLSIEKPRLNFLSALKNPQNWLAGFFTSCLNLPIMVLCALWGASYLQVVHNLSEIPASNVVSLIFIGSIIGCPLAGWLSDLQGKRKPIMIIGAIATLISVAPLFMDIHLSLTSLNIIFFCMGLFTSVQVIAYPLIAESNSAITIGAATSIASVIIMGGGGIGQVIFGWLMQHHAGAVVSTYSINDFKFSMWIFPLTVCAAIIAALCIRETNCTRRAT